MKEIKIRLLEDVANKGKGSVFWVKGNQAGRLVNKGKAEFAKPEDEVKIIPSKELKDHLAKEAKKEKK